MTDGASSKLSAEARPFKPPPPRNASAPLVVDRKERRQEKGAGPATVANTVAPGAKKRAKDCLDELEEDGDAVMAAEPRLPLRTETVPPRPSMHSSSKQRPTPSHFPGRR